MAKTFLIGLDGGTFRILDPFMENGTMPFLRGFVDRGARAILRSIIPALTPPAWTSLVTGKPPGQHGVFDFFQKDSPDSQLVRFATSQDIGTPTVWSLASDAGRRVISLNFPLMFPPPAVNGAIVPGGWMPWRQLRLGCYPPGLFDRLKALPSFNARELALDMAMEEKALEGCRPEEYAEWIQLHQRRERRWFDVLRFLIRDEPADLTAVLFDGVDKLQHLCWRFLDPASKPAAPTAWELEIEGLVASYFRQLDEILGEIVALAGPEANVYVVSDHGFGPTADVFYLNTWLEQRGYLTWASTAPSPDGEIPQLGVGQIARHVSQLDWAKTLAYAATPSSNGIHIVKRGADGGAGVAPEEYEGLRRKLTEELLAIRHPTTGQPIVAEIWPREEVFAGPYGAAAPDLTLVLADGGLVSILRANETVKPRPWPVGTHRPEGILIASGPGIRAGATAAPRSLLDVAPLLLYTLDLPVPEDMVGRVPEDLFEPGVLAARPVRRASGAATRVTPEPAAANVFDAEAEATMLKRLRALGYVE